jgi:hypothetical protein
MAGSMASTPPSRAATVANWAFGIGLVAVVALSAYILIVPAGDVQETFYTFLRRLCEPYFAALVVLTIHLGLITRVVSLFSKQTLRSGLWSALFLIIVSIFVLTIGVAFAVVYTQSGGMDYGMYEQYIYFMFEQVLAAVFSDVFDVFVWKFGTIHLETLSVTSKYVVLVFRLFISLVVIELAVAAFREHRQSRAIGAA